MDNPSNSLKIAKIRAPSNNIFIILAIVALFDSTETQESGQRGGGQAAKSNRQI